MNLRKLLLYLVLSISVSACSEEEISPLIADAGFRYFPADTGLERVYQIDSIYWNSFNNSQAETLQYFIKERYSAFFTDLEGKQSIRVERYRSDSLTGNWTIDRVWSARLNNYQAERQEENVRYLRLVFPLATNARWNGNALNSEGEQEYRIESVHQAGQNSFLNFDSTLRVLQADEDFLTERLYAFEEYAAGAGLYYKEITDVDKDFFSGQIVNGYLYRETLYSIQAP